MTTEIATPKVSIIIPAYNTAAYIVEALDSVFAQTYKNFEVIVINDGSPDTEKLEKELEPYRNRILYIKQDNQGAGPARNTGLKMARGELISFLDADDIMLPQCLEKQVAFLEKNNLDMVWADAYFVDGSYSRRHTYMHYSPSNGDVSFERLLDQKCNYLNSGSVSRKNSIMRVGGFDKNNIFAEDFDLWLRMAFYGARFGYQKDVLLKVRLRLDSLSGNEFKQLERGISAYRLLSKKLNLNPEQVKIVNKQIEKLEAELKIVQGKACLMNKEFEAAAEWFREAYKYYHSMKLKAVLLVLRISPRLLVRLFKWRRAGDLPSITSSNLTTKP